MVPTRAKGKAEHSIVIIGAGPTGLGAASALQEAGHDNWVLVERDDTVGGLARSFRDERGFTWDIGCHVVFSHYDRFTQALDGLFAPGGWLHHDRASWIHILGTWVPYPFQANIRYLPPRPLELCLAGLRSVARRPAAPEFSDFDDFIVRTLGEGIADVFMRPYNKKVWGFQPSKSQ